MDHNLIIVKKGSEKEILKGVNFYGSCDKAQVSSGRTETYVKITSNKPNSCVSGKVLS